MKKYVKAQKTVGDVYSKLKANLEETLLSEFEENLALVMEGKDGYKSEYAPEDEGSHVELEEKVDSARSKYLSAVADLMLAEYEE